MALAQDHGVLDEGIPSIWAYDTSTGEATKVRRRVNTRYP